MMPANMSCHALQKPKLMFSVRTAILTMLMFVTGCQSESQWNRVPLHGTVKLNGADFSGSISLRPMPGVAGPVATTNVTEGKFAFDLHTGPVSGAHSVILMPFKTSRDVESVQTETIVPEKEPFTIKIVVGSAEAQPAAAEESPPDAAQDNSSAK